MRGNVPVCATHTVVETRTPQCEGGHVELLSLAVAGTHVQKILQFEAELTRHAGKVLGHQAALEGIVSGRNRCVGGEHRVRRHHLQRSLETLARGNVFAAALENLEGGMPLVAMPYRRREAHRAQRTHATDAENDLLFEAVAPTASIELVGDLLVRALVLGHVAIEQEQADPAGVHLPDVQEHGSTRQLHAHAKGLAIGADRRRQRQFGKIGLHIAVLLLPLAVDRLVEVTLMVKKPDGDERYAVVARSFDMVAGEDAHAARVELQPLVQPEFHTEIGDEILGGIQAQVHRLSLRRVVGLHRCPQSLSPHSGAATLALHRLVSLPVAWPGSEFYGHETPPASSE